MVVISVKLEKPFKRVDVVFKWKDPFEMTDSSQFLLSFKQNLPVFRGQNLDTVIVIQLLEVIDVFGKVLLVLPELELFSLPLFIQNISLSRVRFHAYQIQTICQQSMLNFPIHWRGRTQRRANIHFHQPRFQLWVNQNVKSIDLKSTIPLLLSFRVNI